jgi:Sphingosine kinase and enzymes related to eukaryotic diacylglycerol kinase
MSAFVIIDPHTGPAIRQWRRLEPKLAALYPQMSVAFASRRGEATILVSEALREGYREIVAVGAAQQEALDGFFSNERTACDDAVLAFAPENPEAISALGKTRPRLVDVGRAHYLSRDGIPHTRHFLYAASFGLPGSTVWPESRHSRHSLWRNCLTAMTFRRLRRLFCPGETVRLIVDAIFDEILAIETVTIANAQMFPKPMASEGGAFDIVIRQQSEMGRERRVQGQKVVAAPVEQTRGRPVLLEIDGWSAGRLPATFEILPKALNVRC